MKVGRRLAMKVLNASKFVLGSVGATDARPVRGHRAGRLRAARPAGRDGRRRGDRRVRGLRLHHRARGRPRSSSGSSATTTSSWSRSGRTARAATTPAASARAALAIALHVQLRLLAPFLPYVTEEVWSWWQEGSIHRAPGRPPPSSASAAAADPAMLDAVAGGARRHPRRQVDRQGLDAHRAVPRRGLRPRRRAGRWPSRPPTTSSAAGKIAGDLAFTPTDATEITVDAEIAPQPPA